MKITSVTVRPPLQLDVVFEDGCRLVVQFEPCRLSGLLEPLLEPVEFSAAYLRDGTVRWPCGAWLDAQLARIKADEGPVWCPA
ncbi:MAG: DUF2442 domain-containing protein [Aquincola sp.]|nr:DUF2442 domain-containing protein [Aquincola sp.]